MSRLALKLTEDLLSPAHDLARHPRHPCHMDAEAVLASSGDQFPEENHLAIGLFHRDIIVTDPRQDALQLV